MNETIEWYPVECLPEKSGNYNVISNDGEQLYVKLDLHCSKCVMHWLRDYKCWCYPLKGPECIPRSKSEN